MWGQRGSHLAKPSHVEIAGKLVCPYHGWTYDCRGRISGVRDRRSFDGLALSERNLVELPALESVGMICSGLAPRTAFDPVRFLAGLGPELASYGFDRHLHYARRTLVRRMNWKMVIDTFLESYHFGVLHRTRSIPCSLRTSACSSRSVRTFEWCIRAGPSWS